MGETYSEQDVLKAIRYIYTGMKSRASRGITVGEIRDSMAWNAFNDYYGAASKSRFYRKHSNKWVLRKLRTLRQQGNVVDREFRWYLSDAELIAQKLLGNTP